MMRRGRGRPKNSVAGESAEFFKVFLPHLCTRQLLIPPDFLKDFSKTLKEKVILKDIGGKTWHVDVNETLDGVFMKNGWESFVNYHSLKVGDFLIFQYDGCYTFVVKIFGTNGCKKEALAARNIATNVKVEEETEEETEAAQTSKKAGSSTQRSGLFLAANIKVKEETEEEMEAAETSKKASSPTQRSGSFLATNIKVKEETEEETEAAQTSQKAGSPTQKLGLFLATNIKVEEETSSADI